jgi:hypothetical protein
VDRLGLRRCLGIGDVRLTFVSPKDQGAALLEASA